MRALDLCDREDWSQPLCIDEKWIKVRGKWNYVFTAVGAQASDLLAIDLFHHKDRQAMKSFLLQVKVMGFRPKSITTDLLLGYEGVVAEVFPDCIYQQCALTVAITDQGYRGRKHNGETEIVNARDLRRQKTAYGKRRVNGVFGDNINVMLATGGYNFKRLMRKLKQLLLDFLPRVFAGNSDRTALEKDF